jgi:hypothetical protein
VTATVEYFFEKEFYAADNAVDAIRISMGRPAFRIGGGAK